MPIDILNEREFLPVNDTLSILTVFIAILIGWLIISSVQYIFQRFFLNDIMSFWAIVGIIILLMILYYSFIKATGIGIYLFPAIGINNRIENIIIN